MTNTHTDAVKTVQQPVSLEEGMARVEGAETPQEALQAVGALQAFLSQAKNVDPAKAKEALVRLEEVQNVRKYQGWFNGRLYRALGWMVQGVETVGPQLVALMATVTEQLAALVGMGVVALGKGGVRAYKFARA